MNQPLAAFVGGIPFPGRTELPLPPRHPALTGVVTFDLDISDDVVQKVRIEPGWLHRGAEKLFEVRDYRSLIMLGDRHDWFSSSTGELVITLAVEQAMRLSPPPRATWLRTLLAELARIHSHLAFLGIVDERVWHGVDAVRELLVALSGNRIHPMLSRVGGMATDAPPAWLDAVADALPRLRTIADGVAERLAASGDRFRGVAVLTADDCRRYGVTGPAARAAGIDLDLRVRGALARPEVFRPTTLRTEGDAHSRLAILTEEVHTSTLMVEDLLAAAPDGPVETRLSRRLKVPEGKHLAEIEAPWGLASALLVSRGGQTPWRLALRTPTFHNVAAMEHALIGLHPAQIPDGIASLGYAVGDLDK
ncbi:NADH-quinone oxidoreductase subunit D [Arachnia propionica]|uniref:NADH-quinone oxidoreductase subunit D n=1 Tax=Arachnia propionica TaxID=1750 RepID=A0A3P1T7N5_9ACTN|nr:NADH-quinone oxidoreductase subunit D [Arachnia propionica]